MRQRTGLLLALSSAVLGLAFAVPYCPFADEIELFLPGSASAGDVLSALGEPSGEGPLAGSTDAVTLGFGGSLTLHLSSPCFDGPGTDLIVCENPFYLAGSSTLFVEALFVEVSSDGTNFARFPTSYSGDTGPFVPTFGAPPAWYRGFAGVLPVYANSANGVPALDVVAGGGDAFDLADLADDPLVISDVVDVGDIQFVRLVDVRAGVSQDDAGHTVWDCGLNGLASADVDAVVAVNSTCVAFSNRPRVEMTLINGFITIRIEDDNGFSDVKHGLTASVNNVEIPFGPLLHFFVITQVGPAGVTLVTGPVPPGLFPLVLKVSAEDNEGLFGGDSVTLF